MNGALKLAFDCTLTITYSVTHAQKLKCRGVIHVKSVNYSFTFIFVTISVVFEGLLHSLVSFPSTKITGKTCSTAGKEVGLVQSKFSGCCCRLCSCYRGLCC